MNLLRANGVKSFKDSLLQRDDVGLEHMSPGEFEPNLGQMDISGRHSFISSLYSRVLPKS